ncbi:MAG: glycosyltransferase family 4 protein [Ilumatobacteraceae bacterium]
MATRRVLFLTPIRPGLAGSGLAHRAAAWQRALGQVAQVHTLVVPMADPGASAAPSPAGTHLVALPDAAASELGAIRGMANPAVRAVMAAFDLELPPVLAAPAWLGASTAAHLISTEPFDVIVCFRSYLAPFAAGLRATAPSAASARLIVDLDDDDAAYHRSRGDLRTAAQYDLLVAHLGDEGATLVAAGHHTVAGVTTLPNCVDLPAPAATEPLPGRILLVANLTYAPNIDAVDWYLANVHPHVVAAQPEATLRLVGRGGQRWASAPGVDVAGLVDDLAPEYAAATAVIAPVRTGSGTRIKVLEAWAHSRPLIATTAAVDGRQLQPGTQALIADEPPAFAAAVVDVLTQPDRAAGLATAGRAHVAQHYSSAVFDRAVAELIELVGQGPHAGSSEPAQP